MWAKYIFRIDDVVPWMNWEIFEKIEKIFDNYWIKPIIWVVPDNKDFTIWNNNYTQGFWDKINQLAKKWWTIAQHWYNHEYITKQSWIIWLNKFSEFAGVSYHEQERKILDWMRILKRYIKNYDIKWFMAPWHSFDKNTCEILKKYNFEYITDGISRFPFSKYWLKRLPQQIRKPQKKLYWIRTICLHINKYDSDFIKKIDRFCYNNKNHIYISKIEDLNYNNSVFKEIDKFSYNLKFWIINYLYRMFISLRKKIKW